MTKEKTKLVDIKERAGSQRSKFIFKDVSEEDFETGICFTKDEGKAIKDII